MSEIGEAVAVLMGTDDCPFCSSQTSEQKNETLTLENNSSKLATNLGRCEHVIDNPEPLPGESYLIFTKYWISQEESKVCMNAHHILPGNASLAKCPAILKWLAGTTIIQKKFYDQEITKQAKEVSAVEEDETRADLIKEKYPDYCLIGDPGMTVAFSSEAGRKAVYREKKVEAKHVTGCVDFDINHRNNGIWLPSNNAIAHWAETKNKQATDFWGDTGPFAECYALVCMDKTGVQFHDAHPDYSDAVVQKLKEFDVEVTRLANACIKHENSQARANNGKPFPAPKNLGKALYKLAQELSKRLVFDEGGAPARPWVTSELALIIE